MVAEKWFTSVSTSITAIQMGRNPITGQTELQLIKSIVGVDTLGRVWEWGNDKWIQLVEKDEA